MQYTKYFIEQVRRKRPYIKTRWISEALKHPVKKEKQDDDRIRYWVYVQELGKYMRVVTLADGRTVHNAFADRNFKKEVV